MGIIKWVMGNYVELALAVSGLVGALELLTRFTPTKADDSFMERLGKIVKGVLNFLKIPNVKRK